MHGRIAISELFLQPIKLVVPDHGSVIVRTQTQAAAHPSDTNKKYLRTTTARKKKIILAAAAAAQTGTQGQAGGVFTGGQKPKKKSLPQDTRSSLSAGTIGP